MAKTMRRSKRPAAYVQQRLAACRAEMKRRAVRAYVITNRADQIYLTGFDGEDGGCIITARDVLIVTDGRFDETFNQQAPWARKHLRRNGLVDGIAACLKSLRVRSAHYQGDHLAVDTLQALRKALRTVTLKPAPQVVNGLREIKDSTERKRIGRAIDVAENAFRALRRRLRLGMTETEIAAILEYEMKRRGASSPSFNTIVAEGPNAALPHAHPGKRVVRKGSAVLVDWGAVVDHYCSDLTRMVFVDRIPPRFKRLYEIVLEAQQRAIRAVAPGQRMCDIDRQAREHITQAGYGPQFSHGLGHGLGLDIHEAPRVRPGVTEPLKPGMVLTIEPGIYIPGFGGVRIEDDVLVTSRGHEVLTRMNKTLDSTLLRG